VVHGLDRIFSAKIIKMAIALRSEYLGNMHNPDEKVLQQQGCGAVHWLKKQWTRQHE